MNCLGGGFPKLRVLKLWMLETLKEWIVEEGAMPELEELEIRGCEKLEKSLGSERLSHLKELTLTNMKREFVEDVKQNLASVGRSHILLTNKFKSSTTLAYYESEENAQIVYSALAVDKELQPDKVKRQMTVSNGKLSAF
ncbi:unnamed protein product [Camellia sinensis]